MWQNNSLFKLIIVLSAGLGMLLLYFLYLIFLTPNGQVGIFH